jgi:L-histidine Nalpha-methyltransferase
MTTFVQSELSQFALDVADGFSSGQKYISARYFYDDLGSCLFEAITLLPEYGLTRADEKLLRLHAREILTEVGEVSLIAELGSGSGRKTTHILKAFGRQQNQLLYRPIDVSSAALAACDKELGDLAECRPVLGDWLKSLSGIAGDRKDRRPLLLLFLGSSIGNLPREEILPFLHRMRTQLQPGDFFLLGADLVKDVETMLAAYDDATGVTAAFNLNILGRMNRELGANFNLHAFAHEVRWNPTERRIEMHLLSGLNQSVYIGALDASFEFRAGETLWTESSHKFTDVELNDYARSSGFVPVDTWIDDEWPFAEALWRVE